MALYESDWQLRWRWSRLAYLLLEHGRTRGVPVRIQTFQTTEGNAPRHTPLSFTTCTSPQVLSKTIRRDATVTACLIRVVTVDATVGGWEYYKNISMAKIVFHCNKSILHSVEHNEEPVVSISAGHRSIYTVQYVVVVDGLSLTLMQEWLGYIRVGFHWFKASRSGQREAYCRMKTVFVSFPLFILHEEQSGGRFQARALCRGDRASSLRSGHSH